MIKLFKAKVLKTCLKCGSAFEGHIWQQYCKHCRGEYVVIKIKKRRVKFSPNGGF